MVWENNRKEGNIQQQINLFGKKNGAKKKKERMMKKQSSKEEQNKAFKDRTAKFQVCLLAGSHPERRASGGQCLAKGH